MVNSEVQVLLQNESFYHGDITRDEAERRLRPKSSDHNYFLMRPKSSQNPEIPGDLYALSIKMVDQRIRHYAIAWFDPSLIQNVQPSLLETVQQSGFYIEKSPGNYEYLGAPSKVREKLAAGEIELEMARNDGIEMLKGLIFCFFKSSNLLPIPSRIPLKCRPLSRPEEPTITPEPSPSPFPNTNTTIMPQPAPRRINPKGWLHMKKANRINFFGNNSFERAYFEVTTERPLAHYDPANPDQKPIVQFKKFPIDPNCAHIEPDESLLFSDILSVDRGNDNNEFTVRVAGRKTRIFKVEERTDSGDCLSRDRWVELLRNKLQQTQDR